MVTTTLSNKVIFDQNYRSHNSDTIDRFIDIEDSPTISQYLVSKVNGSNELLVNVEKSEDIYIASSPYLDVYEVGDNKDEALKSFLVEVGVYFQELKEDENILGPHLREELRTLYRIFG